MAGGSGWTSTTAVFRDHTRHNVLFSRSGICQSQVWILGQRQPPGKKLGQNRKQKFSQAPHHFCKIGPTPNKPMVNSGPMYGLPNSPKNVKCAVFGAFSPIFEPKSRNQGMRFRQEASRHIPDNFQKFFVGVRLGLANLNVTPETSNAGTGSVDPPLHPFGNLTCTRACFWAISCTVI